MSDDKFRNHMYEVVGKVCEEMDIAEKILKIQGAIIVENLYLGSLGNMHDVDEKTALDWANTWFGKGAVLGVRSSYDLDIPLRTRIVHGSDRLDASCTYEFGTSEWIAFLNRQKVRLTFTNTGNIKFGYIDEKRSYEVSYSVENPELNISCGDSQKLDFYKFSVDDHNFIFYLNEMSIVEDLITHKRKIVIDTVDSETDSMIGFECDVDSDGLVEAGALKISRKADSWTNVNTTELRVSPDGSRSIERILKTDKVPSIKVAESVLNSIDNRFVSLILDFLFAFQNRQEIIRMDMSSVDEILVGGTLLLETVRDGIPLSGAIDRINATLEVLRKTKEDQNDKRMEFIKEDNL